MPHRMAELRDEVAAAIDEIEQSAKELDLQPAAPVETLPTAETALAAFAPDFRESLRVTAAVMPARRQQAVQSGRAWTTRAATEPVPTAIAPARSMHLAPNEPPPLIEEWRPHPGRRAAVRAVLVLLVAAAVAFVALNLLNVFPRSSAPPAAHAPSVTLTSLRPVAAAAASAAATAPVDEGAAAGRAETAICNGVAALLPR